MPERYRASARRCRMSCEKISSIVVSLTPSATAGRRVLSLSGLSPVFNSGVRRLLRFRRTPWLDYLISLFTATAEPAPAEAELAAADAPEVTGFATSVLTPSL